MRSEPASNPWRASRCRAYPIGLQGARLRRQPSRRPGLARFVVPPALVREPVLDSADACLGPEFAELGLNDGVGALGLGPRTGVDEQGVLVPRDDQAPALELLGELAGLEAEIQSEPFERALGPALFQLDSDPPVAVHEAILAEMPACP